MLPPSQATTRLVRAAQLHVSEQMAGLSKTALPDARSRRAPKAVELDAVSVADSIISEGANDELDVRPDENVFELRVVSAKLNMDYFSGLPSTFIIHTVGPVWNGGEKGEPELLASCYRESLIQAKRVAARNIAIPAISTGIYGYPVDAAAAVAVHTVSDFVRERPEDFDRLALVCFNDRIADAFDAALGRVKAA